jgi:hypothetical protein
VVSSQIPHILQGGLPIEELGEYIQKIQEMLTMKNQHKSNSKTDAL